MSVRHYRKNLNEYMLNLAMGACRGDSMMADIHREVKRLLNSPEFEIVSAWASGKQKIWFARGKQGNILAKKFYEFCGKVDKIENRIIESYK